MLGVDEQLSYNADWLTKTLGWLPFYDTKAPFQSQRPRAKWRGCCPHQTRASEVEVRQRRSGGVDDFCDAAYLCAGACSPHSGVMPHPPNAIGILAFKELVKIIRTLSSTRNTKLSRRKCGGLPS